MSLLPKWHHCLITQEPAEGNYASFAAQRIQFAYLTLPPGDKNTKIQCYISSGGLEPGERVRVRCSLGNACPYRKGVEAPAGDEMAEIPGDAKDDDIVGDALNAMLIAEEEAVESEPADNAERILDLVEGCQEAEAAKSQGTHFDRLVFPIQKPISSFEGIYKKSMLASEAKYLIAVTTTAHPAIYIAARKHAMSCVVLVRKGNDHALRHGHALAVTWRLTGILRDAPADAVAPALDKPQYIAIEWAPNCSKIIDPFDISKGDKFYEGVNHQYEEAQLDALVTPLVEAERSLYDVGLTPARAKGGRGVVTIVPVQNKQKIGNVTCLVFSTEAHLLEHLKARSKSNCSYPENPRFKISVLKIPVSKVLLQHFSFKILVPKNPVSKNLVSKFLFQNSCSKNSCFKSSVSKFLFQNSSSKISVSKFFVKRYLYIYIYICIQYFTKDS